MSLIMNDVEQNPFIVSTAKDYDLQYWEVETLYIKYEKDYKRFYEELEYLIKN